MASDSYITEHGVFDRRRWASTFYNISFVQPQQKLYFANYANGHVIGGLWPNLTKTEVGQNKLSFQAPVVWRLISS